MKAHQLLVAGLFIVSICGTAIAEDKKVDAKTMILGTWEVSKQVDNEPPVGTTFHFSNDGKVKMSGKWEGKDFTVESSYILEGDKITLITKQRDEEKKESYRITTLTEEALFLLPDRKLSKIIECKRGK